MPTQTTRIPRGRLPGYWMHETSGELRPAIEAYLANDGMTAAQCAAMRAYLRQWIMADGWWPGPLLDDLRHRINGLIGRDEIAAWIHDAEIQGIDPL